MTPQLILFDDARAADWQPFTLTRPAGELLFGAHTMRARAELVFGVPAVGHLAEGLEGFSEPDAAPVIDPSRVAADAPRILLLSRAVPAFQQPPAWPQHTTRITIDGRTVGWYLPAGAPLPDPESLRAVDTQQGDALAIEGRVLENVWELIIGNAGQVAVDAEAARMRGAAIGSLPAHVQLIGRAEDVIIGDDATIEPGVVFDTSHGPIWLDDGVTVRAYTRLAGPSYVGRGSTILGGSVGEVSIGPVCKVHGEVEASVVLGYANKAHDGFLGHAYLGRWVNLGALTTNSDLKNNYGNIRLWTPRGDVDTGQMKLGCLLGDHVKTGIGTMLNTGTVVGTGANLYGAAMPPKYVPPFSWGSGSDLGDYDLDRFLATAERVMRRRGLQLEPGVRALLTRVHERSRRAR
ncbi:MAG: hypothetical protein GX539_07030 [Candidatus Cloacimonetes bacterium]|nr:hypothetical protein [Candidatus Cloacimonadota bacterium]